jgi:HemY protein
LLVRLSELREDWQRIVDLLPRLRSLHVLPAADCDALETQAWLGLLRGASREAQALARVTRRLPRRLQADPTFVLAQARALVEADRVPEAESLLRRALARQWRADLLAAYGELPVRPRLRALEQAEAWLKERPEDADLHACLARLCMHNSLWAQARRHLDLAIARRTEPRWLHWLAETLDALGEDTGAADASRRGLALALGGGRGLVGR